jgi:N6-L-threonylcarbamoyladenine synthase
MIILGIDTSCDDTCVALLHDDKAILSNIVSSQVEIHSLFGGVVPEIASRKHAELIDIIYGNALKEAGIESGDIDLICVTAGPGLIGSVLSGLCFAKGLALSLNKPLIGVNHVEAHAMSIFLERDVDFPYIALVVSGGHTTILMMEDCASYRMLGRTRDDAAGEAFDKIAKYLGIGYPGGRIIEELSREGDKEYVRFPRPMIDENDYDFSFSGLKTSFLSYVKKHGLTDQTMPNLLASFQEAICDVLSYKTIKVAKDFQARSVVVGGGVAANGRLREIFTEKGEKERLHVMFSSPHLCADNGAMVAITGYYHFRKVGASPLSVKGFSRMALK